MDWVSFGKRFTAALVICLILSWFVTILIFHLWTLANFTVTLFYFGLFLVIFGACLQTPFVEAMATIRYAVNPQSTRDTVRHYSERRREQSNSGLVILATGVTFVMSAFVSFVLLPLLPF